eukprot:2027782-Prymnesium_polylepis.1
MRWALWSGGSLPPHAACAAQKLASAEPSAAARRSIARWPVARPRRFAGAPSCWQRWEARSRGSERGNGRCEQQQRDASSRTGKSSDAIANQRLSSSHRLHLGTERVHVRLAPREPHPRLGCARLRRSLEVGRRRRELV